MARAWAVSLSLILHGFRWHEAHSSINLTTFEDQVSSSWHSSGRWSFLFCLGCGALAFPGLFSCTRTMDWEESISSWITKRIMNTLHCYWGALCPYKGFDTILQPLCHSFYCGQKGLPALKPWFLYDESWQQLGSWGQNGRTWNQLFQYCCLAGRRRCCEDLGAPPHCQVVPPSPT